MKVFKDNSFLPQLINLSQKHNFLSHLNHKVMMKPRQLQRVQNALFVCFSVVSVRLHADSGHGLVGLLGPEPESDLQGVHTDGELAADTLKARLGAALQGNASLLDDSHIQTRLSRHLQCVFDPLLVPNREVKANWEFCCLPTFTSAICQPGNTDALVK